MNLVVSHWSANAVVISVCAAVAAVHVAGMHLIAAQGRPHGLGRPPGAAAQAAAFHAGLAGVVVALLSPVAYWAQTYIWIRSVQDLLLAFAAPGLIVLGAPWLVLARGARRGSGRDRAGQPAPARPEPGTAPRRAPAPRAAVGADAGPAAERRGRIWLTLPVGVTTAFNLAWWGWHVPALYDAAVGNGVVYAAEVVTYLGLGMAFWLQLIGSRPLAPRFTPIRRVMLVAGTLTSSSVLAMVLIFGSGPLYPAYLGTGHRVLGVVADQQVGGAILWAALLPPFFITAVALLARWLKEEESEALAAGFDRLLRPRTRGWPSRPGLR